MSEMLYLQTERNIKITSPVVTLGDVGEKEKDGPLGEYFSHTLSDPMCGQESWEEGESELQLATAKLAMQKANVRPEQIRMIFAGDLLAQSIASSFGLVDLNCP